MELFVLLLIHFISLEAREIAGQNDTAMVLSNGSVESHEEFRPGEPPNRHQTTEQKMNSYKDSFRDALSRMSSENVEYYESGNENAQNSHQNLVTDNSNENFSTKNRDKNDKLMLNLLNGPSSKLSDQQNAQSRLLLLKNHTYSSYSIEDNDSISADTMNNKMVRCGFGERDSRITNYLKLGDKVVEEFSSQESEKKSTSNDINVESALRINFDVTHDAFDTSSSQGGLHVGITYKGNAFVQ